MSTLPLAVIGGGPAGAAFAITSARAGMPVTLIERAPDAHPKVCGDFLSGAALARLRVLGLDPAALGAVPIRRVRLTAGTRVAEALLPFAAAGLTRRTLDAALLARAAASGNAIVRGHGVTALAPDGHGAWTLRFRNAPSLRTRRVVLATGKHEVRGWPRRPGPSSDFVGLKWYLPRHVVPDLDDAIELALFPGGYAGLQRVENGRATLCLAVRGAHLRALGGDTDAVLRAACRSNRLLADRLGHATGLGRPIAIAGIPYGFVARREAARGLLRIGDQAAVIPSLAGDGVAMALHAGLRLGGTAGDDPDAQRRLASALAPSVSRASAIAAVALRPTLHAPLLGLVGAMPGLLALGARLTRVSGLRPEPRQALGAWTPIP